MTDDQKNFISELYLEMYKKLFIYARSSLKNDSLAEEAVQESFRIACQKPEALCNSPNPQGWIMLTLKNTVRNQISSMESAREIFEDYSERYFHTEDLLDFEVLYGNVVHMKEYMLLKEMVVDGKSHLELAESRGITVNACKKRVQRAKEILKKKIK